jgi:hypothetical protein
LLLTLAPAQSSLSVSGVVKSALVGTVNLTQQSPGSLTTSYSGTINTSYDSGASSLTFNLPSAPGGPGTLSATNGGSYSPGVGGGAGSAPADYGGIFNDGALGSVTVAVRGIQFTISTGSGLSLTPTGSPGVFSFPSIQTLILSGASDVDYTGSSSVINIGSGTIDLAGLTAVNTAAAGTLQDLGSGQFLITVPIAASFHTTFISQNDTTITITGSLQATGTAQMSITSLSLSNASVSEFRPNGTVVGALSAAEAGSGHTFTYSLVSGAGGADNGSFAINGNQLVTADAFDFAAKSSYSVRVRATDETGSSFDQVFTIAIVKDPSLSRSGNVLTVNGTAGNDLFIFVPGRGQDTMSLNGVALAADTATAQLIVFQGNGGRDTAYLYASSAGANTFVASPNFSYLSGPGFTAYAVGCQAAVAVAGPGQSATAYLYGSAGNDFFAGTPTYAYLSTSGWFMEAAGFAAVTGVARAGGTDQAYLYGGAGGNTLVGTPTYAYLAGSGFWNQADGFQAVVGTAGPAGSYNVAYLYGSAGNDVFVGTPSTSYLYGSGFLNQANGFQQVQGVAGAGGTDLAYLYGSGGAQDVWGFGGSYFVFYGAGFFNEASGFALYYSPNTGWV